MEFSLGSLGWMVVGMMIGGSVAFAVTVSVMVGKCNERRREKLLKRYWEGLD